MAEIAHRFPGNGAFTKLEGDATILKELQYLVYMLDIIFGRILEDKDIVDLGEAGIE